MSVSALVLSLIAIAWNLALTYLRWPRLLVVAEQMQIFEICLEGPPPPKSRSDSFRVIVFNRGAEAATIKTVGLHGGKAQNVVRSDAGGHAFQHPGLDPTTPIRVESHGYVSWTFTEDQLRGFMHGTNIYAFIDVYKSFRLWPWWPRQHVSHVRRIRSKRSVVRTGGIDQPV